MFSKNLKYYRLKNKLSKKALAEMIKVTPMTITHYENGDRMPTAENLNALAGALGVKVSDFLAVRNGNPSFHHGEFRKTTSLSQMQQEYIRESVEEYFSRFLDIVEILGGDVLPEAPTCHALKLSENNEENAKELREHLGFAKNGPIEDLIGQLENKGILIFECPVDASSFSGMNGFVNGRPYIVFNPNMSAERNRSTIAHELAHLMFDWSVQTAENEAESTATAISGAFLFPKEDAVRELGVRRSVISGEMIMVAKEYGISMMMLVKRAEVCGIISDSVAKGFYITASRNGWKTNEPSRIKPEKPELFEQLVYRAVSEEEISLQRGAELLQKPYTEVAAMCRLSEV